MGTMNKFDAYSTSFLAGLVMNYKYDNRESAELIMEVLNTDLEEINRELLDRGYYDD